jgi:hypothetical protein
MKENLEDKVKTPEPAETIKEAVAEITLLWDNSDKFLGKIYSFVTPLRFCEQ